MTAFPRYAIYYAAAAGSDLDRFGAQLLGYDAGSGEDLPFPDGVAQSVPDWRELTRDPRKYGFHATLKAPMALAPGKTEGELLAACETFAATPRPIPVIRPVVEFDQRFYRGRAGRALGRTGAACRGLRARIRFIPRAADAGGSGAAKSRRADAEAVRPSRSLGLSLRAWRSSAST